MAEQTQIAKFKTQYVGLALLLLLYVAVALAHDTLAPLTIGPDELAHYEYVNFIARQGRLPLNDEERGQASYKSDQPPLYHLLAAFPASLVDAGDTSLLKRVTDHPRRQLIERTRHAWGLYNTLDERWPYRGEVLRWHVGRWVAILFGAATVAVTYFIARDVFAASSGAGLQRSKGAEAQGRRGEIQPPISNLQSPISNPNFLALAAAAIVAFIPRFALTGSMLSYETTLAFFSALFLWALLRMANGRMGELRIANDQAIRNTCAGAQCRCTQYVILTSLFAGLAITAKLSALILPVEIVIALWLVGRYRGWPWQQWARRVVWAGIATLIAISWWFGFVLYQFNTVASDGLWVGLLRPLIAADSSDATTNRLLSLLTGGQAGFTAAIENLDSGPPWEWAAIFFRTFWTVGIEQQQPLGWFGLAVALALCMLAAYGLILVWKQSRGVRGRQSSRGAGAREASLTPHETRNTKHSPHPHLLLSLLLLHLAAAFILPLIRYAVTFSLADTAQGRHVLFQAAPAFAILLVWGLAAVINYQLPITNLRFLPLISGGFLLFWTGVQLYTMTWAYLPPLPVSVQSEIQNRLEHRLDRPLNEFVTLAGYNRQLGDQMLRLDLLWQATAVSPVDYLTEVNLLDAGGAVQRQWLGYPASGRYPTRAWDVGDFVRDTVWLPLFGLKPGRYTLTLNLLPTQHNPGPNAQPLDTPLELETIDLAVPDSRLFITDFSSEDAALASDGYLMWQNGDLLTQPQMFRYRETILVTFNPAEPAPTLHLVGPGGESPKQKQVTGPFMISALVDNTPPDDEPEQQKQFSPVRQLDTMALFIVGPDWPTGSYRLQVSENESAQPRKTSPLVQVIDRWERNFTEPPMSQQVEANFANRVKLLGYDLGANRAQPGGGIPVTLYWQGLDWMGQDYTIFTKLLAADGSVHGGRDRLPREGYRTLYWAPGEVIADPFGVPVDSDAPNGVYYLNVGLYREVNGQAVSLPLVQNGQPIDATSVNIGPIKIGDAPPGVTLETANPQVTLNQPFGDAPNLTLLGYDLTDEAGQPLTTLNSEPETVNLTLYWRTEATLPTDYTTFVHLRNAAGETVAQKDQPPLGGAYPTSLWDPGEIIADEITLSLPPDLPPGQYQLVLGLYNFNTGQRLTVPGHANNEVKLTGVNVR